MNRNIFRALCFLSSFLFLAGCGSSSEEAVDGVDDTFMKDGKTDVADVNSIAEKSPEALAILTVINLAQVDPSEFNEKTWDEYLSLLTDTIGVPKNSAKNIRAFRGGADGQFNTEDDQIIESLTMLDAIPYVGPVCFARLLTYVNSQGMPAQFKSECVKDADCPSLATFDCMLYTLYDTDTYRCTINDVRSEEAGTSFEATAKAFVKALQEKDFATMNQYVHAEYGFFMLFNPGAMVVANQYTKFEDVALFGTQPIAQTEFPCELQAGVLPKYSCEAELSAGDGWNKKGCYYNSCLTLNIAEAANFDSEMSGAEVDETMMVQAAQLDLMTSHGIYNTDAGFGVFFGMDTDGKWYVTAIQSISWCDA